MTNPPTALHPLTLKLVVYDLDGTLVNAFEDIWTGANHAMERHGLPHLPFEVVKSYVGDGARTLIRRCLGKKHEAQLDAVYNTYRAYYAKHPTDKAATYPGVVETLGRVRELGYKQAVLTNKPDEVTRLTCEHLGLTPLLDGIWGEQHGQPRKPEAEALRQVMEHFGASADETAMVGDGMADHKVARAAGVKMIAVTWGLLTRSQTLTLRPDALLDKIDDLAEILENQHFPTIAD